jgi:hypothetical protein
MKQVLVIGNENLNEFKKTVAKYEGDKTGNPVFIATSFMSEMADEADEFILVSDSQVNERTVVEYIDAALEQHKPLREVRVSTLGQAIKHCGDVLQGFKTCDSCFMEHLQLKGWLEKLQEKGMV